VNRSTQPEPVSVGDAEAALIERRHRLLGPAYRLFYESPVHLVRGRGAWLYDPHGNAYLDAYNNVACVGHCHPDIVAALANQSALLNTHTRYLSTPILDYAERLLDTLPSELERVMLTCTGSEANDLACRIARATTGGNGFIVTDFAYHGVTIAISELSPSLGSGVQLASTTRTIPAPDRYRASDPDIGETLANNVRSAIADLEASGIRPAALIADTIFSSDGVLPDPAGFLAPAVAAIRDAGGLFIADEVQAGFGRTGAGMWGFGRHAVIPDLATMGKPMGNGHPVAGIAARADLVDAFGARTRYFNTFGGNPVSCAVGLAVLDVLERERLIENARSVGNYLLENLWELHQRYEVIGDVRGTGLFIGVELVEDRATKAPAPAEATRVVNRLRDRRILISSTGPRANVLKIRPPLVFSRENADLLVNALGEVIAESSGPAPAAPDPLD
jgi:4-aminobutyrate aminotransferase-like enzyme